MMFLMQMGFFKHLTFASFPLFFTIFSIFIKEISKIRYWVQLAVSVPSFELFAHDPQL